MAFIYDFRDTVLVIVIQREELPKNLCFVRIIKLALWILRFTQNDRCIWYITISKHIIMMNFLQLLMKRPTDKNIRIGKVLFWLVIFLSAYMSFFLNGVELQDNAFGMSLSAQTQDILKYSLLALGIIPMLTGGFDINFIERKYSRIIQVLYAVVLFWYSSLIIGWAKIWVETLYFLLAFIPLVGGITGKFITKKWLKAGQKITKIRV